MQQSIGIGWAHLECQSQLSNRIHSSANKPCLKKGIRSIYFCKIRIICRASRWSVLAGWQYIAAGMLVLRMGVMLVRQQTGTAWLHFRYHSYFPTHGFVLVSIDIYVFSPGVVPYLDRSRLGVNM
jgi:hypothetical protein